MKFPGKIREQGKVSKVVTIPKSISDKFKIGATYQFSADPIPLKK